MTGRKAEWTVEFPEDKYPRLIDASNFRIIEVGNSLRLFNTMYEDDRLGVYYGNLSKEDALKLGRFLINWAEDEDG